MGNSSRQRGAEMRALADSGRILLLLVVLFGACVRVCICVRVSVCVCARALDPVRAIACGRESACVSDLHMAR